MHLISGMKTKFKIVNTIKEKLKEEERSQRWLSRKTGIHVMTLNGYVNNDRQPPADSLYLIAEALNCTTDSLLEKQEVTED